MRTIRARLHLLGFTISVTLSTPGTSVRNRAVNLTLNRGLVAQAKTYSSNLSVTMEELLTATLRNNIKPG